MSESATHLGLLLERTDTFRARRGEPAVGYWALLLQADTAILHLHLHNLQCLTGEDAFVYQAWLIPPQGEGVPLPALNASADGTAFCTVRTRRSEVALAPGTQLVVTAEPRQPRGEAPPRVLEGPWVALGAPMQSPGAADADQASGPAAHDLFAQQPEPAVPVLAVPPGYVALEQSQEVLAPAHDLARSGSGTVVFDFPHGAIVVSLEDAPAPDVFGQDPITSRPFNIYAGWLLRQDTGDVAPLGFFRRVRPGAYRLQARGAAALADYDTVVVSAEDRAGAFDPLERKVFSSFYSPFVPVAGDKPDGPAEV